MKLILPWPPSMNSYWQQRVIAPKAKTPGAKRRPFVSVYVSEAGQKFQQNVLAAVLQQLGQHQPIRDRLSIRVKWFPPDRRGRDIDNPLKPLLDALAKAGIYENDKQIRRCSMEFCQIVSGGRCEVQLAVIASEPRQKQLFQQEVNCEQ